MQVLSLPNICSFQTFSHVKSGKLLPKKLSLAELLSARPPAKVVSSSKDNLILEFYSVVMEQSSFSL